MPSAPAVARPRVPSMLGVLAVAATVGALLLAGCSSSNTPAPSSTGSASGGVNHVDITNRAYSPTAPVVMAGTVVHFQSHDGYPHSLTVHDLSSDKQVNNAEIAANGGADFTFPHAGKYHLTCNYHPSMFAEVTAQ